MAGGVRVFISHAYEDNALCMPVVAALSAWGLDYFFDSSQPDPHRPLTTANQQQLVNSQVLLRICTPAAQRSERVAQEVAAFRMLQAQKGGGDRRLVSIILDAGYVPEPLDAATLFIDATKKQRFQWMGELARPLGVSTASRRLSRRSALGLGVAGAVALASATSAGVALYTGRPQPKVHDPSRAAGNKRWSTAVSTGTSSITPRIAMAGGVVFATSEQGLVALDAASGAHRWTTDKAKSGSSSGGVVTAAGHVYLGDEEGNVYAVNAATGAVDWRKGVGFGHISTPVIGDGLVCVVSSDYVDGTSLVALKADTDAAAWTSRVAVEADANAAFIALAFSSGTIYLGSFDHHLRAISARDGSATWDFLARGPIVGAPAVGNGSVIFGSDDGYVYALDASAGALRWRFRAGWAVRSSPAVVNGVVYAGSDEGYLYALDAATGALYWRAAAFDVDAAAQGSTNSLHFSDQIRCLPAVGSDAVYVTAGNSMFAFSIKDGSRQWRYVATTDSGVLHDISSPVLAGDLVYCGAGDHAVHAVNT